MADDTSRGDSRLHLLPADPIVTVRVEPRRRWLRLRLPRLRLPKLRPPGLRLPRLRLPGWISRGRAAAVAGALLLLVLLAPVAFVGVECVGLGVEASRPSPAIADVASGVKDYFRSEASTYLALPEWYVVYSADAYAAVLRDRAPSQFPYFRAIGQYWDAYRHVCRTTKRAYPFDARAHLWLGVVGMSFSVEHAVKGVYESTVGRAVEWIASHETEEDAFAYRTAQAYGSFRHTTPWYEFPFGRTLAAFWRSTSLWGPQPVRKWERKLVLTAEYGLKGVFALVVRNGARLVADPADRRVHARIESVPDAIFADSNVRRVKALARRSYIVSLPRHEAFTVTSMRLVARGVRFLDVAGNDEILVSAIAPRGFRDAPVHGELVFAAPLLEDAARRRVALKVPVGALHEILPALERRGARIEHVYEY